MLKNLILIFFALENALQIQSLIKIAKFANVNFENSTIKNNLLAIPVHMIAILAVLLETVFPVILLQIKDILLDQDVSLFLAIIKLLIVPQENVLKTV